MYSVQGLRLGVHSFFDMGFMAFGMIGVAGLSAIQAAHENFRVLQFTGPLLLAYVGMFYLVVG